MDEKGIELLKECLGFINFIKQDEGEGVDESDLEQRIIYYLEETAG